ncbi:MAG: M15 family metallopeptidase [Trueperaceae bacterium]|nr:M15 family metallopeptidase [Trueperaceae bacterium]
MMMFRRFTITFTATLGTLFFATLLSMSAAQTDAPSDSPPPCEYLDIQTPYTGYDEWHKSLLDTVFKLPADYAPNDLVSIAEAGLPGNYNVRAIIIDDLRAFAAAARERGHPVAVQSAYRSYSYQERTFNYWVRVRNSEERARLSSARPGHSEHQLGTAIDLRSEGGPAAWDLEDWAATPAGAWAVKNSWRYGFVLSYPKGTRDTVCYIYEPWHYRYMGRELAAEIHNSGLTLREWLWLQQPDTFRAQF